MRQSYWEIRGLGVEFVAAANDTPEVNKELRERLDLPFTLLSDVDGDVAKAYRAFNDSDPSGRAIALTSMFLIDSSENDRIIRFENVGPTARHRVSGPRLVEEIQKLQGAQHRVVSVLVQTEVELIRHINALNDPPVGLYREPPADQIQRGVMVEREVLGQMVMGQYEEIHRYMREGWTLVAVSPEVIEGTTVGQRYVFEHRGS